MDVQGTGACRTRYWTFKNGKYEYVIGDSASCGEQMPPSGAIGDLTVTLSGKEISKSWCFSERGARAEPVRTSPERTANVEPTVTPATRQPVATVQAEQSFEALGKPDDESIASFVRRRTTSTALRGACVLTAPMVADMVELYGRGTPTAAGAVRVELLRLTSAGDPYARAYAMHMFDGSEHNVNALIPAFQKYGKPGFVELWVGGCLRGK